MNIANSKLVKQQMETKVKLNLGCWVFKREGWVNIDIDPQFADVVADCNNLPYADNSVDEIYAGHILEHCPDTYKALAEWKRVLKPGGKIGVCIPDMAKAVVLPVDVNSFGPVSDQTYLDMVAFGAPDRKEQNHFHIFTAGILLTFMRKYFNGVQEIPTGIAWQTLAEGVK